METNFRTVLHCLSENVRTKFARQTGRNGVCKEEPNMTAVAGSRAFQHGGRIEPPAGFEESCRIRLPSFAVKVHRQKEAGFVLQHGIDTHDEIEAPIVSPRKV